MDFSTLKSLRYHTTRLSVRILLLSDAAKMAEYVRREADFHRGSGPTVKERETEAFWRRVLSMTEDDAEEDRAFRFGFFRLNEPEELIGSATLTNIIRGPLQQANIGYALAEAWQGKGLMTEALRHAVIPFAFDKLNLHRVQAGHRPDNLRSAKVLRRLDFVIEGYVRDYLYLDGVWVDHVMTGLVNPNWRRTG